MIDYIQQIINYIPLFVFLIIVTFGIRYYALHKMEQMKIKKVKEKEANKPKGLLDTIIDSIDQAPRAKQLLDAEIDNLMKKGATEEQMKSLKGKKQFVDFMANDYVQMLAVPGIQFAKDNLKGLIK